MKSLPSNRGIRGFTMIELVFALVLLGILTGLAAPSMTGWMRRTQLEAAVGELTADLAQVRMLAVRSGAGATLTIVNATTYEVQLPNGTGKRVDLSVEYPGVRLAPDGGLPMQLSFDSRGFLRNPADAGRILATSATRNTAVRVLVSGRAFVE
jgi:prepilin-type N-terminal cleavage/methylation domain-containing protein